MATISYRETRRSKPRLVYSQPVERRVVRELKGWWKSPLGKGRKSPSLRFAEFLCTIGGASVIAGYALTIPAIPALLCFILGDKLQELGTRLYDANKKFDGERFK